MKKLLLLLIVSVVGLAQGQTQRDFVYQGGQFTGNGAGLTNFNSSNMVGSVWGGISNAAGGGTNWILQSSGHLQHYVGTNLTLLIHDGVTAPPPAHGGTALAGFVDIFNSPASNASWGNARVGLALDSDASVGIGEGSGIAFAGNFTNGTADDRAEFALLSGVKENSTNGDWSGKLTFYMRHFGESSFSQKMELGSTGNFGIGATNPQSRLVVQGDSIAVGNLANFVDAAQTPRFTILNNGRIGIGTTNPGTGLTLAGDIGITTLGAVGSDTNILSINGGGALSILRGAQLNLYGNNSSSPGMVTFYGGNVSGGDILFAVGPTWAAADSVIFKNGGQFGIGNTAPGAKLDVTGDIRGTNIVLWPNPTGTNTPLQFMTATTGYPTDNATTNGVTAGGIWYGGTSSNSHTFFGNLYKVNRSFAMAQSVILADLTVTNSATGGASNIYTVPMAANYLTVGKVIEPKLDGLVWQNNNAGSFPTVQAWINSTNLLLTVPLLASQAITAGPVELTFSFTCRSIGSGTSASLIGRCKETQSTTSGGVSTTALDVTVNPVTFDSTINNTINITVSNSVAGGGAGAVSFRLQQGRTLCIDSVPKLPGEL